MPCAATQMDLDSVILSEVSQTEKEKLSYDISCKWNLKRNGTNEFIYKTERESQAQKMNLWLLARRIVRDFQKVMYTLLYLKWITNENLRYNTWGSAQWYETACMEAAFRGEWIHVWLNPLLFTRNYHNILNQLYQIQNVFGVKKRN